MAGNATEEALIQQIDNPSHSDLARISVPLGLVMAILTYFFVQWQMPVVGAGVRSFMGAGVGIWVGLKAHRALSDRALEIEATALQAARDAAAAETERRIAQARGNSPS